MADDMHRNEDVAVGAQVYTSDDDHLGTVKEVQPGFFKVDAKLQLDYWLQSEFASASTAERVTMSFTKHDLHGYKVIEPGGNVTAVGDDVAVDANQFPENAADATIRAAEKKDVT